MQKVIATENLTPPAEAKLPAHIRVCRSETWRQQFVARLDLLTQESLGNSPPT